MGNLPEERAVDDRIVGPWCSLATQWRVGAELDSFLPAKHPQLVLPAARVHLHLL